MHTSKDVQKYEVKKYRSKEVEKVEKIEKVEK
jgi:hypothetical protein